MTEKVNAGAAPVSKYAAKKAANAKAAVEEVKVETVVSEETQGPSDGGSIVVPIPAPVPEATKHSAKFAKDKKKKDGLPPVAANFPEHVVQIALLIKNNAEIRRFTALGILNYLLQKGEIRGDKRYVSFKWNKFAVKANGLMREYSYNEPFFLNALVAAFSSFSASAQRTIDAFCKKEMSVGITKAVDQEEVDNIAALNEQYQGNGNEGDEE